MFHIGFGIREVGLDIERYLVQLAQSESLEHLEGPQGAVIFYLNEHQDDAIVQKDIERFLNVTKATASGLVKRMEKNGFIQVVTPLKDKRYNVIQLTDYGRQQCSQICAYLHRVHDDLTRNITKEDLIVWKRVMQQVKENANQATQKMLEEKEHEND